MKKITSILCMTLMILMSAMFTSCDEDDAIAYTLEGTWNGNMYVSMQYDGRVYEATSSELCFSRDPYRYSSGSGYWIDHYSYGPWGRNYVANHINWTVRNGYIEIYLIEEGTYVQIYDYSLSDNYFVGTIYYDDQRVSFRLRHTSSPNWGSYDYGWGYYDYAKQGKIDSNTRSAEPSNKPVRMFGHGQN